MCYADPICQAIEWKNGADCRLFDNQNDSGPQHSGYHVYKLTRQVPDAIWSGALASDIPEYGYAQYSDVADVDVCKAMCYADPICQAIEWKNGADCRLFDNQNDSGPQHSGYHVYKLTRQVPAVLPSLSPTISPISSEPTPNPTPDPTRAPSKSRSFGPTPSPTSQPTVDPTKAPSKSPSSSPSTSPTAGYRYYRIDVSQNLGGNYWCIEELSFYDMTGSRLVLDKSLGSAQTMYSSSYSAEHAFNEQTDGDGSEFTNYYCSENGITTGWLMYDFQSPVKV